MANSRHTRVRRPRGKPAAARAAAEPPPLVLHVGDAVVIVEKKTGLGVDQVGAIGGAVVPPLAIAEAVLGAVAIDLVEVELRLLRRGEELAQLRGGGAAVALLQP